MGTGSIIWAVISFFLFFERPKGVKVFGTFELIKNLNEYVKFQPSSSTSELQRST